MSNFNFFIMNREANNPVKELFSNVVKICKAFEEIWLFRDNCKMVEKAFASHRYFLVEANGNVWVEKLERRIKTGREMKSILDFLAVNYRSWQRKFMACCGEFKKSTLPEPHCFNKAANAMVNNFDLFDSGLERKKALIGRIKMVLALYPDHGYDPEADLENYKDKLYNGSLILGGEEIINLRSAQVIAEENYKLSQKTA